MQRRVACCMLCWPPQPFSPARKLLLLADRTHSLLCFSQNIPGYCAGSAKSSLFQQEVILPFICGKYFSTAYSANAALFSNDMATFPASLGMRGGSTQDAWLGKVKRNNHYVCRVQACARMPRHMHTKE